MQRGPEERILLSQEMHDQRVNAVLHRPNAVCPSLLTGCQGRRKASKTGANLMGFKCRSSQFSLGHHAIDLEANQRACHGWPARFCAALVPSLPAPCPALPVGQNQTATLIPPKRGLWHRRPCGPSSRLRRSGRLEEQARSWRISGNRGRSKRLAPARCRDCRQAHISGAARAAKQTGQGA